MGCGTACYGVIPVITELSIEFSLSGQTKKNKVVQSNSQRKESFLLFCDFAADRPGFPLFIPLSVKYFYLQNHSAR
jgi:hypothetical protein